MTPKRSRKQKRKRGRGERNGEEDAGKKAREGAERKHQKRRTNSWVDGDPHEGEESTKLITGERLRDLFREVGDDFNEMGLNGMKGGPEIFKSWFVSSFSQAAENCDEDGSNELTTHKWEMICSVGSMFRIVKFGGFYVAVRKTFWNLINFYIIKITNSENKYSFHRN